MVNKAGCTQSLQDIFKPTPQQIPPSGSGDCAAPKLIQYAFRNNFKTRIKLKKSRFRS